eukprot:643924-Rhodomonas_salina.1
MGGAAAAAAARRRRQRRSEIGRHRKKKVEKKGQDTDQRGGSRCGRLRRGHGGSRAHLRRAGVPRCLLLRHTTHAVSCL